MIRREFRNIPWRRGRGDLENKHPQGQGRVMCPPPNVKLPSDRKLRAVSKGGETRQTRSRLDPAYIKSAYGSARSKRPLGKKTGPGEPRKREAERPANRKVLPLIRENASPNERALPARGAGTNRRPCPGEDGPGEPAPGWGPCIPWGRGGGAGSQQETARSPAPPRGAGPAPPWTAETPPGRSKSRRAGLPIAQRWDEPSLKFEKKF